MGLATVSRYTDRDEEREDREEDDAPLRVVSAVLGVIGGAVFGSLGAFAVVLGFGNVSSFGIFVLVGAALGGIAGYVHGKAGFDIVEGAVHHMLGIIDGVAEWFDNRSGSRSLSMLYMAGFVLGIAVLFMYVW